MVTFAEEFEKDGEEFTKFLSLSTTEWATLKQQFRQVEKVLNEWDEAYVLQDDKLKSAVTSGSSGCRPSGCSSGE